MKTALLILAAILAMNVARSETPPTKESLATQLHAVQVSNQALIEKQQKTLQLLDELKLASEQLKALGKRN